ncbi:MAG: Crp/Fnr family transcriptional regulator [Fervidobacterium sp.]
METLDFESGEVIIRKGEESKSVYILKSGRAKVTVSGVEFVLTSENSDVFGLEALVGENYTETCIAIENVKVIKCSPQEFMEIYAKTDVGKKAIESFMKRTAKALGWV